MKQTKRLAKYANCQVHTQVQAKLHALVAPLVNFPWLVNVFYVHKENIKMRWDSPNASGATPLIFHFVVELDVWINVLVHRGNTALNHSPMLL